MIYIKNKILLILFSSIAFIDILPLTILFELSSNGNILILDIQSKQSKEKNIKKFKKDLFNTLLIHGYNIINVFINNTI